LQQALDEVGAQQGRETTNLVVIPPVPQVVTDDEEGDEDVNNAAMPNVRKILSYKIII
jgi:hypothetical protein